MIKRVLSKLRKVTMSLFAVLCAGAVWAEEGEVTTPDVTPEPTPSTSALAIDPSAGYILTGLGELGDQAAVVFTNSEAAANWTVPKNLKNVEILAVGGGGGGGGHYYSSTAKNCQGGAGGGAGAVVTGFIKDLAADQVVNVTVGAGGAGGAATTSATTGAGKGGNGGNTVLKVGDVTYVTAYGGGGDGGYNSAGVANGGSNSGVRQNKTAVALKTVTVVGEGAENLVTDIVARANKGGGGYSTSSGYPGAGGGGADGVGHPTYGGSSCGGTGGFGYVSYITGERVVYGAGGGGGIGKNGGDATYLEDGWLSLLEGAGLGKAGQPGSDALANQGAGGGGGSWKQKGGNGGSGIVVLRFAYSDVDIPVDVAANILPKISDKAYTGLTLVSGLENTYAYTVEELGERINVGQQTVRVTLNDGYVWADGDTNKTKEFTWNITQEVNNWKVEPYLSHTAWPDNFASSVNFKFTVPETSFGVLQAELSANGAAPQPFSGTLPTESGSYTLRYWVEGTANWAAKEWTVNFKIYQSEAFAEGYKVYGLGENGDEVAVVFTQNATWTVPANLKSAQFLVVGGGGGGGADCHDDAASGGAGGGGGGVVTGEVDLTKDATVAVTIGAGGAGGTMRTSQADGESGTFYGASKKGGNSVLSVGGTTYVTAYGGGRDRGTTKRDTSSITTANMSEGGQGGSNGGSRGGFTADQSKNPTMGAVASNAALRNCTTYGNKGGKGCSEYFYGYPSAGGGGGATEAGGDAGNNATGWPGGKGGEGLASDITGARLVYGSGGGGSSTQGSLGGVGGSGAGNGGDREDAQGTSALANQGGGGGGTSRELTNGGNGGSGVVVIRYSVYAAEVDGVPYATLSEAFDAAQAGETVKLLNDVTLAEKLTIKKAVTLDLNGCTLSETVTDNYGAFYVGTAGNFTITDSATGGKIATDGGVVVGNYGTVTVNGGTIEAGENPEVDVSVYNFYYNGSTYGRLTVTGGTVGCIWNCGAVTVSGGTVDYVDTTGEMTVAEGVTIGELLLKVGDYNSELPNKETLVAPETFVVKTLDGSCALYRDGKWVVVDATDNPFLVGETGYATLAAAFDAVDEGGVITLLRDVEGPGLVINKSVTIDFSNKTYTFNQGVGNIPSNGFQILKDNTVTLKNGTLQIAESAKETFYTVIQNYANLTLNNMTVDGTNTDKWSATDGDSYAVSLNCGTVSIEGATTITANDQGDKAFAFDVCKYASYTPPTVTLNTTGTISGKVAVSGGDLVIGAENTATLSAIDFTAGSVEGDVASILTIPEDKKLVETDGVYTLADKDVLAKVGDKLFETIDEAFAAAQAGDTVVLEKSLTVNEVLQIPANVTLDLNGNELQALAVVGKLSMNGGALKTYDTNTQTFFFMAAPAQTAGALYWTSDAVMTIGADYTLSLDGGSVTLPASWRSLLKQTLTIKSGASFVIPEGVELNLRGNAVVESGATLTCEGTIALGNTYDAVDTSATLTSAQLAEGKVTSKVEGYRVVYANGVYSLEEIPAEFAAQVGDEKYATLQAALDDVANLAATIKLIANTKEKVTVPAGFTGTIDLGGFTLTGRIDSYATGAVLKNGSVIHTTGSKAAIQIEAGSLELTDINMESNYHGVRLNGDGTTATINSGTYRITSSAGTYNLIYASKANAKFYVYGGDFYNNNNDGSTYVLKAVATGSEINVYGGTFNGGDATTFENVNNGVSGLIKLFGGTYTGCNPSKTQKATVQPGYAVEGTGPWAVVASWTAPMPDLEEGDSFSGDYEYTSEVLSALEAKAATSVDVKVNGVELKGDEAIKALNTAVASFDNALTFDGTAAILDIEIKVTAVNTEDPAASTVVVKSGETVLSVKTGVKPTVKYFYPETKTWGSDKPESGAVLFKLVFEVP